MRSNQVVPFQSVAPSARNGSIRPLGKFSVPLNIKCSNRCAKPVLPFGSSFDPTLYQTVTAATGALWSS